MCKMILLIICAFTKSPPKAHAFIETTLVCSPFSSGSGEPSGDKSNKKKRISYQDQDQDTEMFQSGESSTNKKEREDKGKERATYQSLDQDLYQYQGQGQDQDLSQDMEMFQSGESSTNKKEKEDKGKKRATELEPELQELQKKTEKFNDLLSTEQGKLVDEIGSSMTWSPDTQVKLLKKMLDTAKRAGSTDRTLIDINEQRREQERSLEYIIATRRDATKQSKLDPQNRDLEDLIKETYKQEKYVDMMLNQQEKLSERETKSVDKNIQDTINLGKLLDMQLKLAKKDDLSPEAKELHKFSMEAILKRINNINVVKKKPAIDPDKRYAYRVREEWLKREESKVLKDIETITGKKHTMEVINKAFEQASGRLPSQNLFKDIMECEMPMERKHDMIRKIKEILKSEDTKESNIKQLLNEPTSSPSSSKKSNIIQLLNEPSSSSSKKPKQQNIGEPSSSSSSKKSTSKSSKKSKEQVIDKPSSSKCDSFDSSKLSNEYISDSLYDNDSTNFGLFLEYIDCPLCLIVSFFLFKVFNICVLCSFKLLYSFVIIILLLLLLILLLIL